MHWTTKVYLITHDGPMANAIFNSLRDINQLLTMYGVFDKQDNIIFNDQTDELRARAFHEK